MTHRETIERVAQLTGTRCRPHTHGGVWKDQFRVKVQGGVALEIIKAIRPYLITKAEVADIALKFPLCQCGRVVSNETRAIRGSLKQQLCCLNS